MVIQYGENNWNDNYISILRILLVSFEGLDANQISFFSGIERYNLHRILLDLKPFIIVEPLSKGTSKGLRYKLYHQSLVEFLKKEYLDYGSLNSFFIPEQESHRQIVEKYYDKSKDEFKINLLNKNEYGLRYLPDHLFALMDFNDPEGIDWHSKLLQLAKNKEFKQKQLDHFPFETDLPLKTIKKAFEASLIKEDPVSTAEMLLIHASNIKKVFIKSPLCILKDIDIENDNNKIDDILERSV